MSRDNQADLITLRKRARRRLVGAIALTGIAVGVLWNVVDNAPPNADLRPESVDVVGAVVAPATPPTAELPQPNEPVEAAVPTPVSPAAVPVTPPPLVMPSGPIAVPNSTPPKAPPPSKPEPKPAPVVEPKPVEKPVVKVEPVVKKTEEKPKPTPEVAKPVEKPPVAEKPKPVVEPPPKVVEKPAEKPKRDPAAILEGRFDEAAADKKPAAKAAETDAGANKRYIVQIAALSDAAKADELRAKLASVGVQAKISRVETSKGEISRVRLGPFNNEQDAKAALAKAAQVGVSGILIPQ